MIRLSVTDLTKRFPSAPTPALDQLSFDVDAGEVFALVGPSGCGKTTTLRIIAGFERPDAGTVRLGDEVIEAPHAHVPPEKRRIGLVFQVYALFPHLDVLHNVTFGLRHLPRSHRSSRAHECLEMVGLPGLGARRPHELSGGQQQRVAIARSLATRPRILLLDEPFSNLDPALRAETRNQVRDLLHANGMSALLVTHDQEEALSFADRIGVMNQGRVVQAGDPQRVYAHPNSEFVASFLGRTNILDALASGPTALTPLGTVNLCCPAQGPVKISVRPEHIRLVPPNPALPTGRILARHFKGHDLTFRVDCAGKTLTVQTDYACPFQPGQEVALAPSEPAVVIDPGNC